MYDQLASVILGTLAIVIATHQQDVRSFVVWAWKRYQQWKHPESFTCDQLLWSDLDTGTHSHNGQAQQGQCTACRDTAATSHHTWTPCWKGTLGAVFNTAWDNPRRIKSCKKPAELSTQRLYLKTEAKVILAYLLCTNRSQGSTTAIVGKSKDYFLLEKRKDDLLVGHLGAPKRLTHVTLSKAELTRILDGWPPFYRDTYTVPELAGQVFDHPLRPDDRELIKRPSWIVAVGLGLIQPTDTCVNTDDDDSRSLALNRFKTMVTVKMAQKWPHHAGVVGAVQRVQAIIEGKDPVSLNVRPYGAGPNPNNLPMPSINFPNPNTLAAVTRPQADALLAVFHDLEISNANALILGPNLTAAIDRAVLGYAAVTEYYKLSRSMIIPDVLLGDVEVYLKDCSQDAV